MRAPSLRAVLLAVAVFIFLRLPTSASFALSLSAFTADISHKDHIPNKSGPYSGRNFSFGTNPDLETIFLGKLYELLGKSGDPVSENSSKIWKKFASSFQYKIDRFIVPSNFDKFFSDPDVISSLQAADNQTSLMWSGVGDIIPAYEIFTQSFVMETSPLVGILNNLMFCGSPTDPSGFNMTSCEYGDLINGTWLGTWVAYWAAASRAYARLVRGNLTIILGGNPSFRPGSFLGSTESVYINGAAISNVRIMTAPSLPGHLDPELCGEGSILQLQKLLISRGVSPDRITCVDQPPLLKFLRCSTSQPAESCLF